MKSHVNRDNKPLCGKATWIEDGDCVSKHVANCEECKRLVRKEDWAAKTPEEKEKTFLHTVKELVRIWSQEVEELNVEGYETHPWRSYPKTEAYIKEQVALTNRPDLHYFISTLTAAISHVTCKHEHTKEESGNKEVCLDCKWHRSWYFEEHDDDEDGIGFGPPRKKIYTKWDKY